MIYHNALVEPAFLKGQQSCDQRKKKKVCYVNNRPQHNAACSLACNIQIASYFRKCIFFCDYILTLSVDFPYREYTVGESSPFIYSLSWSLTHDSLDDNSPLGNTCIHDLLMHLTSETNLMAIKLGWVYENHWLFLPIELNNDNLDMDAHKNV